MVSFKLFAGTDVGLRDNNEDNFSVCPDLSLGQWIVPADSQETIQLGQYGCLLVVADGMGGQNAGEVASAIAIDTVHDMFVMDKLADIEKKPDVLCFYLKKVIVEADQRVKYQSSKNENTRGMGSTIVLAWIIEGMVHVAWLGDSRAYSIIPGQGISRLTKDHSYVQKLVDSGVLSEEEAMNHPDSNIITKSLGDSSHVAKPDSFSYPLLNDEVILLCSDGLCGVCTDSEIAGLVLENKDDLKSCKEVLTEAALSAGGSDNITIALALVSTDVSNSAGATVDLKKQPGFNVKRLPFVIASVSVLSILVLLFFVFGSRESVAPELHMEKLSLQLGDSVKFHVLGQAKGFVVSCDCDLVDIDMKDSLLIYSHNAENDTSVSMTLSDRRGRTVDSKIVNLSHLEMEKKVNITIIPENTELPVCVDTVNSFQLGGKAGFGGFDIVEPGNKPTRGGSSSENIPTQSQPSNDLTVVGIANSVNETFEKSKKQQQ